MTREELRDRLAPIYRQLRQLFDEMPIEALSVNIGAGQILDSVVYTIGDTTHLHYANDIFRDWKPTEATR